MPSALTAMDTGGGPDGEPGCGVTWINRRVRAARPALRHQFSIDGVAIWKWERVIQNR